MAGQHTFCLDVTNPDTEEMFPPVADGTDEQLYVDICTLINQSGLLPEGWSVRRSMG